MKQRLLLILFILLLVQLSVAAQNRRWPELRGKELQTFDWNCADPAVFPKRKLKRVVEKAIVRADARIWGDRAVAMSLKKGSRKVYFVPLACGGTGNCSWRIYSQKPIKDLGKLGGEFIYTYTSTTGWPTIITYTHMSASEGILVTYRFRNGRYRQVGGEYPVDSSGTGISDFGTNVKTHPMPAVLENAHTMCQGYGG